MAEAKKEVLEREMELIAWQTANLMNIHLKRKVTINQLLGKEKKAMMPHEKEAQREKFRKLRERRGDHA